MRLVPLLAPFALSSALLAQTAPAGTVTLLQAPPSQNCPVGLAARHAQDGAVVNVSPSSRHPGQGYRLTFSPTNAHAIVQARITLHGLSGHQIVPAGEKARADATERFNVSPASGTDHLFHSTVYTEKLTGVQWVELNEVTYADGSIWHESATATCRVVPDGFMLVASGH